VTAVSIGVGCANLTSLINNEIGWRNSIIVVTMIGLFITFLCCFLEEPRRKCEKSNQIMLEQAVTRNSKKNELAIAF
jgi:predicted MFS family arabinose efflux permease